MKKSINLWALPYPQKMTLKECLQLCKDAGFDGVEVNYALDGDLTPETSDADVKAIGKMAAPAKVKGHSFRGFNLFLDPDYRLFLTLGRGEWAISGFRAADLRAHIEALSPGRSSYLLKRLRTHGLIKKVAHRYKYYLTKLGRRVLVTAMVIREYFVQATLMGKVL